MFHEMRQREQREKISYNILIVLCALKFFRFPKIKLLSFKYFAEITFLVSAERKEKRKTIFGESEQNNVNA